MEKPKKEELVDLAKKHLGDEVVDAWFSHDHVMSTHVNDRMIKIDVIIVKFKSFIYQLNIAQWNRIMESTETKLLDSGVRVPTGCPPELEQWFEVARLKENYKNREFLKLGLEEPTQEQANKDLERKRAILEYNKNITRNVDETGNHWDKVLIDPGGNTAGELQEALIKLQNACDNCPDDGTPMSYPNEKPKMNAFVDAAEVDKRFHFEVLWSKVTDVLPIAEEEVLLITKFGAFQLGYLLPLDEEMAEAGCSPEWAIYENPYEATHYENDYIIFWAKIKKPPYKYLSHGD